jgi:hypothetical protein
MADVTDSSRQTEALSFDPQRREKLAEQTLLRAISLGSAASKTALLWFIALALIWWTSLEPQMRNLTELTERKQKLARIDANIHSRKIFGEIYAGQLTSQIQSEDLKSVDDLRVEKTNASENVRQSRDATATVSFKLPGLDPIPVPSSYAPLIWSILMLGLLIYVSKCRARMLILCGRALRIYRELRVPDANLEGIAAGAPWWIAPLPRREGSVTRPEDLLKAFGWPLGANRMAIWNGLAFVLLLSLHARVAWITFRTEELVGTDLVSFALTIAVFLSLGIAFVVILGWFKPIEVPDRFADEPKPAKIRTRDFVTGVAISLLFCLAAPILHILRGLTKGTVQLRQVPTFKVRRGKPNLRPSQPPPGVARDPRFRRKRHIARSMPSTLPMGFYQNNHSSIIHYVSADRKIAL